MNTKKVCEQLNVTPKMLRIYESAGLICPKRGENNYREYSAKDILDIETIARLRNIGLSINDIKKILQRRVTENEYLETFYIQIKAIEKKQEELVSVKKSLVNALNNVLNERRGVDIIEIVQRMVSTKSIEEVYIDPKGLWDFDEMAANYVERFLKNDPLYKNGIAKCREIIKLKGRNKKIIDVGCGTCNLWEDFDNFCELTAVDSSLNMLNIAIDKVPWAKFYLLDMTEGYGNLEEKFDYVVSTFMLHHIAQNMQMKVIENMAHLCKEHGEIIIVDKHFKSRQERAVKEAMLKKEKEYENFRVLQAEQPIFVDSLESFIKYLDLSMEIEYLSEETACFIIKK